MSWNEKLLVLTYHRILPESAAGAVAAGIFDRQLDWLQQNGWYFITASQLLRVWNAMEPIPADKMVMLTFDDGWADNLTWADPLLHTHGARATLALSTSLVNPYSGIRPKLLTALSSKKALEQAAYGRSYDSFLTWQELAQMRDSGRWDIQAHGHSHLGCYRNLDRIKGFYPRSWHWTMEHALGEPPFPGAPVAAFSSVLSAPLTRLRPDLTAMLKQTGGDVERRQLCRVCECPVEDLETPGVFSRRVKEDLNRCRQLLREKLDIDAKALFWPWGHYSERSVEVAKSCGFELLLTMNKDAVTGPDQRWALPRIAAPETMGRFRKQMLIFSHPFLRALRRMFSH